MSTATQRRAWNDAMRSAGAVLPPAATVYGGHPASSSRGGVASRASDRRRNKRRDRARKASSAHDGGAGGTSSMEEKEYRVALHMDLLEGATDGAASMMDNGADDDDEYDEFAELENDDGDGGGRGKGKAKRKRKRKVGAGGAGKNASSVPKYLKARSLASILMEEAGRSDSVAKQYVDAAVRPLGPGSTVTREQVAADYSNSNVRSGNAVTKTKWTNPYPSRKFCPVTGLFGQYTEPKTGIPYATLSALEQIRERPPPWMNTGSSASASYWEAVKSLQNNP